MPITVITGQPGNGKTLYMMQMLDAEYKSGKRPIYVHGVTGSLPDMVRPLLDARAWETVEDGSIIFIDEAWKAFGHLQDGARAPAPGHVLALATHRHRGLDFVMTTQMTNQLFPFMRGLVGEHIHVDRKFGTGICTVYKWGELCDDTKSQAQRERSLSSTWSHPSALFGQFNSAVVHTIKRKIPWRIALIPICLVLAIGLGWMVYAKMKAGDVTGAKADVGVADTASPSNAPHTGTALTPVQWLQLQTPRISGVQGSQPIFDGRRALAVPATYCVIVGNEEAGDMTACRCYTEQATPIEGVSPERCRTMARHGEYDPFRAPVRSQVARSVAAAKSEPIAGPSAGLASAFVPISAPLQPIAAPVR